MNAFRNIPLQQKSEQDKLRLLYRRIERERLARSHVEACRRVTKALSTKRLDDDKLPE